MSSQSGHPRKQNPDQLDEMLQKHFQGLMKNQIVNNAVVSVESLDGTFSWTRAQGPASPGGPPITQETPIWIASVTKLYTAAVIFKLAERNQVAIDERMSAYLSQDLIEGLHHAEDGEDHTGEITLRHLLGHSSGLPDYLEDHPEGEKGLLDKIVEDGDRSWTLQEAFDLIRDRLPAHFPPQPLDKKKKKIRYSDTNYQLLIAIIESVTGEKLQHAFEKFLFQPLGLDATFLPGTSKGKAFPEPAAIWAGEKSLKIPLALQSFRDLNSTTSDMLGFMRGLVQGRVFDDPETFDLMRSEFNSFGFSFDPAPTAPTWPIEYGMGMMRIKMPRLLTLFKSIPPVMGHTGVSGSWLFYAPDAELLLAGTVNQMAGAALPFRFIPRLLGDLVS